MKVCLLFIRYICKLQLTPTGMNLALVKQLLYCPDPVSLLQQAQRTGQNILIIVHHDSEEIHQVLERVKKDGEH